HRLSFPRKRALRPRPAATLVIIDGVNTMIDLIYEVISRVRERLNQRRMRDAILRQLRVLQAIARCAKIATAANALGVTPPAVTLQLKLLEEAAGAASI
ncbi:MAG: helix-turn-helix domain-containing protein, partial [Hyphomicrobium sp.]